MGANELDASPEMRSHYLKAGSQVKAEGRASEEPKTVSAQPSPAPLDGDLKTSSQHQSSSNRPQPIDQSSIIKTNDESAFHNNMPNIFPSANATNQAPAE